MTDDEERTDEERTEEGTEEETGDDAASKAETEKQEVEEAKEEMERLEEGDPPEDLADWPGGKAKYQTYGGPEGESGYDEGETSKLGPSSLRHHEDGKVTIEGEEVDDPDEYKGEPIPGGPSDPDAPPDPAMIGNEKEEQGRPTRSRATTTRRTPATAIRRTPATRATPTTRTRRAAPNPAPASGTARGAA